MAEQPLRGRLALVTGAAQGIGAAIARRLAADGADVGVNDLVDGAALAEVVAATGGFSVIGDMTDPGFAQLIDDIERNRRPVDVLVCNAAYMTMAPFSTDERLREEPLGTDERLREEQQDDDEDDWWRVVDTNLAGTLAVIQAVLPGMRRAGGGNIVVIASEWGVIGWPGASAYSASKAGLISLTKTLGRELAREGITVNAVAPGVIDTPQLLVDADAAGVPLADMHASYAADIPVGRIGRPEEIASAVALLARRDVGALVGQTLQINGGSTRCRV
ncbi:SDR family NAD(P)-dependent oxidoreductase [Mycolicibacterium sp. 050158]|uniref:SDR family NAD(P)-dependent oxidoreductase n=1 Tax=Mycolicibacterium sp. 050158 TaxID=3090602 RepID=UPI00299D0AAC|nr:SDR family NAD(P)-dependent oxidoreductase [Mycolicibacterium sp. 050158]MDX1888474.1 SDR family NAD(P)-dependent oxidoreductase [Mycolicibacterium sp. 050158]